MNSKLPGLSMQTVSTELDLTYRRRFSDLKIPEAYESLILDALKGDHSNFVRDDELDASWRVFTPLLHYLDNNTDIMPMEYPYGKLFVPVFSHLTNGYKALAARPSWTTSHLRTAISSATPLATNGEACRRKLELPSRNEESRTHTPTLRDMLLTKDTPFFSYQYAQRRAVDLTSLEYP